MSISKVTGYKASFTNSSSAFHMQECFKLANDDVLRLRKMPLLVSFLVVGW
jgi:hypothetical protein